MQGWGGGVHGTGVVRGADERSVRRSIWIVKKRRKKCPPHGQSGVPVSRVSRREWAGWVEN